MLIIDVTATKAESPAPRRQPLSTTCEVWKCVENAIIIMIVPPSAILSGSFENSQTSPCLAPIKSRKRKVEQIKAILCPTLP